MLDDANIAILLVAGNGFVFLASLAVLAGTVVFMVHALVLEFASVIVVTLGVLEIEVRTEVQKGFVQAMLATVDFKSRIDIKISSKYGVNTTKLGIVKHLMIDIAKNNGCVLINEVNT